MQCDNIYIVTVANEESFFCRTKHIYNTQALAFEKVAQCIKAKLSFTFQNEENADTDMQNLSELEQVIAVIECTSEYYNIDVLFLENECVIKCCNSYMI